MFEDITAAFDRKELPMPESGAMLIDLYGNYDQIDRHAKSRDQLTEEKETIISSDWEW